MQKLLTGLTIAAVAAAGLSTAAFARPGHHDRPFAERKMDPAMLEEMRANRITEVEGMDANNDGLISAEELANAEIARATQRANDHAARMVERMDVDGDGLLSAAELAVRPVPERGDAPPPPPPEGEAPAAE